MVPPSRPALKLNSVSDGGPTMRIWRKAFLMIVFLAGLTACEQEIVSPEQQITGKFAFDDGTGLTGEYIEFSKGVLSVSQLSEPYPFAEGTIWDNGQANVVKRKKNPYMLADRVLTSGGEHLGLAELRGGVLHIGNNFFFGSVAVHVAV